MAALLAAQPERAIIDEGVAKGDTDYIWRTGGIMLVVTLVQVGCSIWRHTLGAKTAMSFGSRRIDGPSSSVCFFSSQRAQPFGAPSLITRKPTMCSKCKMLVLMSSTMFVGAPITMIGGICHGVADRSRPLLAGCCSDAGAGCRDFPGDPQDEPLVPVMQTRSTVSTVCCCEQITGIRVVRGVCREPYETARFARPTQRAHRHRHFSGPLYGVPLPHRDVRA
jgi:ATP-binding cassette subfamily B protein